MKTKIKKVSLTKLEDKLWKVFSEFIRRRDSDENGIGKCVTCGYREEWKYMDAGHFISRKHKSTKFDEMNNNIQCKGCNGPGGAGRQYEHGKYIDLKYGEGTADNILQKSRMICKRDRYDLEVLIDHYKTKLKEL